MAESYLGADVFRAGIRAYMARHAYAATTADLWRALEEASGKPVGSVAAAYTEQAGLPLIVAETRCVGGDQRLTLRQERFTVHDPAAKALAWQVPITYGPLSAAQPDVVLLDGTTEIAAGRCGEPFKVNLGDIGYYRVQYDGAMRAALAKSVAAMSQADQVNLLADSWALVEAGRSDATEFFDLMDTAKSAARSGTRRSAVASTSSSAEARAGGLGPMRGQAQAGVGARRLGRKVEAERPRLRAAHPYVGDFGDDAVVGGQAPVAAFWRTALAACGPADGCAYRRPQRRDATYDTFSLARKTTKPTSACATTPPPPAPAIQTSPRRRSRSR
jgi:hypothetical protein